MPLIKADNVPMTSAAFSMADIEQHARQIIARAKVHADQLLADAKVQADKLKANASLEGKALGIEQGKKEGREQATTQARNQALAEQKAKLIETVGVLTKAARELDARLQSIQQEARSELIPLSLAIARRVTGFVAQRDPAIVQANVHEAVRLVMSKAAIRIAIHPSQKQAIESLLPQLKLQWPTMQQVELSEDASIATGGCRVYSAGGVIDAELNKQIDRIAAELACEIEPVGTTLASPVTLQGTADAPLPTPGEPSLAPTKADPKP